MDLWLPKVHLIRMTSSKADEHSTLLSSRFSDTSQFSESARLQRRHDPDRVSYLQHTKTAGLAGLRHDMNTLNNFGYSLLGENRFDDVLHIFQLKVAEYPQNNNPHDGHGYSSMNMYG